MVLGITEGPWFAAQAVEQVPGQWTIGLSPPKDDGEYASGTRPVGQNDDYLNVSGLCKPTDARAIAQVPEMLALCERIITADANFDVDEQASLAALATEARAILRKVEG